MPFPMMLAAAAPYLMSGAGAIMGALGSKGGNKQTQNAQQQQSSSGTMTPTAAPPIQDLWQNLGRQYQQGLMNPMQYFPGSAEFPQGYVGPSSATQQAWGMGTGAGDYYRQAAQGMAGAQPYYQQAAQLGMQGLPYMQQGAQMTAGAVPGMQGTLGTAGGNYNFLSNAADVANNPYVQAQLGANQQQVTQALKEQWLPQIQQQSVGGNAVGSSRQGIAQAQGIERAAQQLANTNASTMLNAYGQGLGAQQSALGYTGAMLQNQLAPGQAMYNAGQMYGGAGAQAGQAGNLWGQGAGALGAAGGLMGQGAGVYGQIGENQEMYQQRLLDEQKARWQFSQMEPWQRMQMAAQGMGAYNNYIGQQTTQQGSGTNMQTTTGASQNPWASAIGGGLAGYGLYSAGKKEGLWGQPITGTPMPNTSQYTGVTPVPETDVFGRLYNLQKVR